MNKIFITLIFLLLLLISSCSEKETVPRVEPVEIDFDFVPVNNFFKKYVKDGKVDYQSVKDDDALREFINQVKNTEPYNIPEGNERFAFWINAYNAFTIKLITDHYPLNSIVDIEEETGVNPWSINFIEMAGGRKFSLDEIEKEIIIPDYKDPRIHYALVCAAESCPEIIPEAYLPEKLDAQLDLQAAIFLDDQDKNYLDKKENALYLSTIYKWYASDFIKKDTTVTKHILKYINEGDKNFILENNTDDINYIDYSWKLNDAKENN
ncbi:MAG TPA: DUF547 domain-containing protein [Ignavibacteria bacterium]|nr:DUF547 domain-containing protein [Ignavibacteria bacterium]HQY51683.1 DUF547 domain-containing protein [Ignavibacteria bacterium]HRA99155.1 DUF547 domain-containing protein [Ignavibacteria bacterium]